MWPFVAKCDGGTDTQNRQCRQLRDARAAELRGATVLVDGDSSAFQVGTWNAKTKSAALTLSGSIASRPIDVEGSTSWKVSGVSEAKTDLINTARTFADEATAKKYAQSVAGARVQFLVSGAPASTEKNTIAFKVLGYRVYMPCTGAVVVASDNVTGPGEIDKSSCPKPAAK